MMDGDGSCGRYCAAHFCWSQILADRERGSGADLFIVGVALFDADRNPSLLRGGRISAD